MIRRHFSFQSAVLELRPEEFEELGTHLPQSLHSLTVRSPIQTKPLLRVLNHLPYLETLQLEKRPIVDREFFIDKAVQRLQQFHLRSQAQEGLLDFDDDQLTRQRWVSAIFASAARVTPEGVNALLCQWTSGQRDIVDLELSFPFEGDQLEERIFIGLEPEPVNNERFLKRPMDEECISVSAFHDVFRDTVSVKILGGI